MNIKSYLTTLGLTAKESDIFLKLYELGTQPASVIARHISTERTSTYKLMLSLVKKGYLSKTSKNNIGYFFVNDIQQIKEQVQIKKKETDFLEDGFDDFKSELQSLQSKTFSFAPKMTLYDGVDGIANMCNDILQDITKNNYRMVKLFSSNTFDSYAFTSKRLGDYYEKFINKLSKKGVNVEIWTGEGIELMESIATNMNIKDLFGVPAGNNTVNIFVVGGSVYTIVFEDYPSAIKIKSKALANTMHFIFEHLK